MYQFFSPFIERQALNSPGIQDIESYRERVLPGGVLSYFGLLVVVCVLALRGELALHGDSLEYIIQTQALVFDRSTTIDVAERSVYWNDTNPHDRVLVAPDNAAFVLSEQAQAEGGFGGLYPDREGNWHYYHFFLYPLVVAPLYWLLHQFSSVWPEAEYWSFRLVNIIGLLVPFLIGLRTKVSLPWLLTAVLLLFSPLVPYVDWAHPELLLLALVVGAFALAGHSRGHLIAPLLLGLAASQNLPIVFFFPVLWFLGREHGVPGLLMRPSFILAQVAGALLAGSSMLYYYLYFGVRSLIEGVGQASLDYASAERALALFVGPMLGGVWTYPALFFLLLGVNRRGAKFLLFSLPLVLLAAFLCSTTVNLNSGHLGSSRYLVWLLAPLLFALLKSEYRLERFSRNVQSALMLLGAVATLFCVTHFHLYELPIKKLHRFTHTSRAQPEVATLYQYLGLRDDLEVLVENIQQSELGRPYSFDGVYIWNVHEELSYWVISKRFLIREGGLRWSPEVVLPSYSASPRQEVFTLTEGYLELGYSKSLEFWRHPVFGNYILLEAKRAVRPSDLSGARKFVISGHEP